MRRGALLAAVLLLASCGGRDGGDEDAATTTEAPTTTAADTTTTTAAPDPFTVPADPADIDEAYVEAVLTELERINGDALRLAVSEGLSPSVREALATIYGPAQLRDEIDSLVAASSTSFEGYSRPPGDVDVHVDVVLLADLACISADVTENYSAVSETGPASAPSRVELRPSNGSNPTPWIISLHRARGGTIAPPDPCSESPL